MLLIRAGRLARLTLFLALLVVGLAVVALVTIQTAWFKDWLRGYVSAEARRFLNGELAIGRLDGNLLTGIELENVSVRRNGEALVSVKNLGIDYSIIDLVSSGLMLDDIRITQPHILLRRTKDGWSLGQLLKSEASEADREGPGRPVRIGSIGISDGSVTIEDETASPGTLPRHITRLDFKGGFAYEPVDFTLDVAHLSFRAEEPGLSLNSLSGRLATRGDDVHVERLAMRTAESSLALSGVIRNYQKTPVVQAKLTSDKTTLRELGAFVPALSSITLQPAYEISVDGPLDALKAELSVRSKAGQVTANVVADVQSERPRLQGTAEALHVRLEEAAPTLPASHVTGRATFDIAGRDAATLVGTLNVDMAASQVAGYRAEAIKASARVKGRQTHVDATARGYGASLSAKGIVDLPASSDGSPTIDLKGRAANVDFARLPRALGVPSLRTRLGGTYHVTSAGARTDGDVVLARSSVEGATIIEGTKISGRLDGKRFTAEATGGVEGVDPARVSRALRTQTRGQAAPVDDRLAGASVASATFDLTASGRIGGSISGEARVDVAEARGLDGTLRDVVLHARVQEGAGSGSVVGVFEGLNPGRATGRRDLDGSLSGTLEARAAVPDWHNVAVETVAGSTRLDLTASKAGLVSVERGTLRASASNGMLDVQQLELRSNIADVDASGRVGLAESATSTLGYKVTVNDAGAAARLAGVADVSGTGTIEGQITGTRADLATTGTLTATRFLYGQTAEVVSTAAEYEVAVPDLNLANVRANVKGHANLVKASGVDVEAIELQARYADRGLDFDTTVRQGDRRLAGSGHIELPPDAVHVRLDTLAITAPDVDWRLTAPSRIDYARPRLTVSPFAMRGGDQTVSVAGTLSVGADASSASVAPDAPLTLRATSIDLAAVDRLAGTRRGLQGRLDADLTASGTLDAPVVDGTLAVRDGAVDTFKFERFTTTIEAGERHTNVTARLDQRPGTWLDAKATLPAVSTLRTGKAGTTPIDATLTTSPIDLGLVQSFTAAVREVTGTLEANVRVSGTIETPSVEGQVRVQNGAFTVAAFDTPFMGLDAHVAMKGSQMDIQSLRVLDADGKPLAISGALTLPGARAAAADLRIKADDFSLMNGKLGELEVDTDLHMRGTLGEQVRVDGEVAVHQGRLELESIARAVRLLCVLDRARRDARYQEAARRTGDALGSYARATAEARSAGAARRDTGQRCR